MQTTSLSAAPLEAFPLFAHLSPELLTHLERDLPRRHEPTGQRILRAEETGQFAYLIESGTAKVCVEEADGRLAILALLGPGDLIGEMSLIDGVARSATVEALEDMWVRKIKRDVFEELLGLPLFNRTLMRLLTRRLRLSNAQNRSLATQDVRGRVARQLVALAAEYGQRQDADGAIHIPLRLTQTDLAALVGSTRQRVNPTLGEFKHRGYIQTTGNCRVIVCELAALERIGDGA